MTSLLQAALISSPCWRCKHSISTTARTTSMGITAMSPVQNQRRVGWVLTVTGKAVGFGRSSSSTIRCMANPRRVKMVAKQIMRELSDMLLTDTVLQYAILPEASLGADLYLSSLATITDVQVSPDLQVVKVYVSVFGDERGKEVAIAGLKSKTKYVRSELGRRMKLRLTPEIRFIEDEAFERGSRVIAILDKIKNEKSPGSQNMEQLDASEHDDDDRDGEDPDEGIIYVE